MPKLFYLVALAAACMTFAAEPAFAQAMSAGQPPAAANPRIVMPVTTINCAPSSTAQPGQPSSPCKPVLTPQPVPMPVPAPAPKPAASLARGFAAGGAAEAQKVVSYFQRGAMRIDAARAFGLVLIPRVAATQEARDRQYYFCEFLLSSLDYTTPDEAARDDVLATYWPLVADVRKADIEKAFRERQCDDLIDWYDHSLARAIARKAGIEGLSGPLLITWPSANAARAEDREPLIVDFANADPEHATKALRYWFNQLRHDPSLWTNRIREGTIRAELADAINDTAGVMLAVLSGKWESVAAVNETP